MIETNNGYKILDNCNLAGVGPAAKFVTLS